MKKILLGLNLLITFFFGCSFHSMTAKATKPLIVSTFKQVMDESDVQLAKSAIESHLKLLEGVLAYRPNDLELLNYASMGYTAYSLAYIEDDSVELAMEFYNRATQYAFQGLSSYGVTEEILQGDLEQLENQLNKLPKNTVSLLFWGSLSWSLGAFLNLDNPKSLDNLSRAEFLMKRVYEIDSTYFYGAPIMYFAILQGYRPKVLGGDPDKALIQFENCRKISNNTFLLERVFRARYLYVPILDQEKFEKELEYVLNAPMDILPNGKLLTAISKLKAKRYQARVSEWF